MSDFKVGDVVRVAPRTLEKISKSFLNYDENLKDSNGFNDSCVMLGGIYSILNISGVYCQLITNNENNVGLINKANLVLAKDSKDCSFTKGSLVKHIKTRKEFCVEEVINGYYLIFSDCDEYPYSAIQNSKDYESL